MRTKYKSRFWPIAMVLIMVCNILLPANHVFANNSNEIQGENEAASYMITTNYDEYKQSAEVTLQLVSKENVTLQSVTLPDGTEQEYTNGLIKYKAVENGTISFLLKYTISSVQEESEVSDTEIQIEQEDLLLTADISVDILGIIKKLEAEVAFYPEPDYAQKQTTLNDINTVQVSDFNELKNAISNPATTIIEILQNIKVDDTLQITANKNFIANTPVSLIRESTFPNTMFNIADSGSLSLGENVSIDGSGLYVDLDIDSASAVTVYGSLQLDGGTIRNHTARINSPIIIHDGGNVSINNGEVSNNSITEGFFPVNGGGGIRILSGGKLEMNGGSIHNNSSTMYGGGICVNENGEFILNDGKVFNNKATHPQSLGGGIFASGQSTFHMYNGEIYSNEAESGGGITLGTSYDGEGEIGDFIIEKGAIRDNKAFGDYGGGIFLPSPYNELKIKNVYVSENEAQFGGALYNCPTGKSKIYITNGGAFVDNTATVGGNLLWNTTETNGFYIGSRILGGGKQTIYSDFNPRYQIGDEPLDKENFQNVSGQLLLHNEISQNHKALAKEEAGLVIEHNTSGTAGGGIANNGQLIIGEKDLEKTVQVSKIWNTDTSNIPSSITIDLIRIDINGNEVTLETLELNETNHWSYTFENLPGEFSYNIREHAITGFTADYEVIQNGNETQIKITNNPELISKNVTKVWVDNDNQDNIRPTEVKVQLYADDKAVDDVVILNADNKWTYTWTNLAKFADDTEISYSIKEVDIPDGYTGKVEVDKDGNFILTNTHTPDTTYITVHKLWNDNNNQDGIRPTEISVQLFANGKVVGTEVKLTADKNWGHTWKDLAKFAEGKKIKYTVQEVTVPNGYTGQVSFETNNERNFTLTNTHTPEVINKTVNKVWADSNNQDRIRPTEVSVQLYANDKAVGDAVKLNADNNWSYTWTNLAKNAEGKEIVYSVKETAVPNGYTDKVEIDKDGNFTLTNTHASNPDKPIDPDKPTIPTIPEQPIKPNQPTPPAKPNTDTPQTGDTTNLGVLILALLGSSGLLAFVLIKRRKRNTKEET